MDDGKNMKPSCTHIFKNGESCTNKQRYTEVWLALIRTLSCRNDASLLSETKDFR